MKQFGELSSFGQEDNSYPYYSANSTEQGSDYQTEVVYEVPPPPATPVTTSSLTVQAVEKGVALRLLEEAAATLFF